MYLVSYLGYVYPPAPYTERSYASSLAISRDNKWLAYCTNDIVVIRSIVSPVYPRITK
jgi:hypothetical protein